MKKTGKLPRGFTFIEMVVVLGIGAILVVSALPMFSGFQASSQYVEAGAQVVQSLRLARERSLSGFGDSPYGVFFVANQSGPSSLVVFKGNSYAARQAAMDMRFVLGETIQISTSLPGNEVVFSKNTGMPSVAGQIILRQKNKERENIVYLNTLGMVEIR
jgi:prepilin-type N-terminal cleavage/methylation domain-containing protein